jgi:SAM-dependent methyltransferase
MSWLANTRTSYDTVAEHYADQMRDSLATKPYLRAMVTLFAELVRGAGDGPVADMGCGSGHVTAFLRELGLAAFGIDLSPRMVEVAAREYPDARFEVGSMTELDLADDSLAGVLAWWSLIHMPDDDVAIALAHFRRVLRPGAPLMVGFHEGNGTTLKTDGYGGHPMNVHVHRRPPARMTAWLHQAGFTVDARVTLDPEGRFPGAVLFAR